ncbi:unnamed protein product [Rhodiola kirilowii]
MWLTGGGGGGGRILGTFVRYFSRQRAVNVRKINPKLPPQEASAVAQNLYQVIKERGPLTVSGTWSQAQDASVDGLNSKTHLKLLLKWMQGRKMLKQFCLHAGSNKKFLLCTLPEDPHVTKMRESDDHPLTPKRSKSKKKITKKKSRK